MGLGAISVQVLRSSLHPQPGRTRPSAWSSPHPRLPSSVSAFLPPAEKKKEVCDGRNENSVPIKKLSEESIHPSIHPFLDSDSPHHIAPINRQEGERFRNPHATVEPTKPSAPASPRHGLWRAEMPLSYSQAMDRDPFPLPPAPWHLLASSLAREGEKLRGSVPGQDRECLQNTLQPWPPAGSPADATRTGLAWLCSALLC